MRKNSTVKNDLPHLLEALYNHPDCPDWLQTIIWDGINDRVDGGTKMTATYWASCLESALPDQPNENEIRYGSGIVDRRLTVIQGGVQ